MTHNFPLHSLWLAVSPRHARVWRANRPTIQRGHHGHGTPITPPLSALFNPPLRPKSFPPTPFLRHPKPPVNPDTRPPSTHPNFTTYTHFNHLFTTINMTLTENEIFLLRILAKDNPGLAGSGWKEFAEKFGGSVDSHKQVLPDAQPI